MCYTWSNEVESKIDSRQKVRKGLRSINAMLEVCRERRNCCEGRKYSQTKSTMGTKADAI